MMPLSFMETAFLGLFAGLTVYLGLIVARFDIPESREGMLNGIAVGVLFFLLIEILYDGVLEPLEGSAEVIVSSSMDAGTAGVIGAAVLGVSAGLIGLGWFEDNYIDPERSTQGLRLAYMIAIAIGLHNFSEGLAIGQSAATGEISLAALLIVGFALHNITEGFSIAAPLANMSSSLKLLGILGLMAGGPVFVGAMIGQIWTSEVVSVLFLALAGGALIYVIDGVMRISEGKVSSTGLYASVAFGLFIALAAELVVKAGMLV